MAEDKALAPDLAAEVLRQSDTITALEAEVERLNKLIANAMPYRKAMEAKVAGAERKLAEIREIAGAQADHARTWGQAAVGFRERLQRIATLSSTPERREG